MIAVVHTGGANLASVTNALERLGSRWILTEDPEVIARAERVILPGVGAAADAMGKLQNAQLVDVLRGLTQPTLGICLGMQLLFERSLEGPTPCLGVIPGEVVPITARAGLTIPHMGWNTVHRVGDGTHLLDGIDDGSHFYFVHSYRGCDGPHVKAASEHGEAVAAIVQHGNFYGTQFHPERSAQAGARLLENFLRS